MALSDYLTPGFTSGDPIKDKQSKAFLDAVNTYTKNIGVLKTLGAEDTTKKPERGFLTNVLSKVAIPGNIIRAGLFEATGQPTPELQSVSGLQELKGLLSGEIQQGFGKTPLLSTRPDDDLATRLVKYGASFVGDVVTDPISYLGAPGALSRDAAATLLVRHTLSDSTGFIDELAKLSPNSATFIDDLASKSRQAVTDALKVDKNLEPQAGVFLEQPNDVLAKQYLGNYLAEGLKAGGRKEVVNRLTDVLGSKQAALSAFNILPEEVKGGIVVTNLLGKPITKPNGEYIRLTPGTGEMLGKPGEAINKLRLGASVLKGPLTKNLGKGGEILAEVNKKLWKGQDSFGKDRFIDYVGYKDAIRRTSKKLEEVQGAVLNAVTYANHQKVLAKELENYTPELFEKTFKESWHAPLSIKPNLSAVEKLAYDGAQALRKSINDLHTEMKDLGIEIGTIGDPETWTPLVLSDESIKALEGTERGRIKGTDYSTMFGRTRYMFFNQNAKEAQKKGFQAKISRYNKETKQYEIVDNPDVYYNNAMSANEIEKALDPNTKIYFEEDPVKAFTAYATSAANRIATHKMVEVMKSYGMLIKDVPNIKEIVDAKTGANLIKLLTITEPDVQNFYQTQLDSFRKQLDIALDPARLNTLKTELTAARDAAKIRLENAIDVVKVERTNLDIANKNVRVTTPNFKKIAKELDKFEKDVYISSKLYNDAKVIVDELNKKLFKITDQLEYAKAFEKALRDKIKSTGDANLKKLLRKHLKNITSRNGGSIASAGPDQILLDATQIQMDAAYAARDAKIAARATAEVNATVAYALAVENKRQVLERLIEARKAVTVHRNNYNQIAVRQAIEDVDRLDGVVGDYLLAKQAYNAYRVDTRYSVAEFRAAEMKKIDDIRYQISAEDLAKLEADLAVRVKVASEARKLKLKEFELAYSAKRKAIKEALGSTRNTILDKKIGNYVASVLDAADKLTFEEFQAYTVLSSKKRTERLIDLLNDQTVPDDVRNQMFGDLVRTYDTIRGIIPASAFTNADEAVGYMLSNRGIDNIKKNIFTEKPRASEFGKYLGSEGMRVLNLNRATRDLYASVGVNKLLEDMYVAKTNPTHFEKFVDDVIDPMLNLWKWVVTLGRGPGFVTTNLAGGLSMNFVSDVSLQAHLKAAEHLYQYHTTLSKLLETNPERSYPENVKAAEELLISLNPEFKNLQTFLAYGGIANTESTATLNLIKQAGFDVPEAVFRGGVTNRIVYKNPPANETEKKYRQTIDFILSNPVSRAFTDMGQSSELFLRYSAFLDGVAKYKDVNAAMDRVYLLHFNYQDLSSFENWLRRLIPFYTWTRNNVPAQFRMLLLRPGKIQRFVYANEEFKNQFSADDAWLQQVLPEFIVNQDGFASRFKFGGNNIAMFLKLPYVDLNRLFTASGVPNVEQFAGMLGPATKTPLEVATGINLTTGQGANPAGESVPGYYNIFRPFGLIESTTAGDTRANSKLVRFMNDVFPFLGTAERTAAALSLFLPGKQPNVLFSEAQQNAGLSNLLNVSGIGGAGGFSTTTLTPTTLSAEVLKRTKAQQADIKKLAASGNYDVAFIRQQLRLGKTPEQIALMLQSGQGQIQEGTGTGITDKAIERYKSALGSL